MNLFQLLGVALVILAVIMVITAAGTLALWLTLLFVGVVLVLIGAGGGRPYV